MNRIRSQVCTYGMAFLVALFISPVSWAQLSSYGQDFEGLNQTDPDALTNDGWLVYGNVWDGAAYTSNYLFGYGPFGAPNGGQAFSGVEPGQGGADQGAQQLVVYSDYGCCQDVGQGASGHVGGTDVEANVFQEQVIGGGNVGESWSFLFDAKLGNIEGGSTAAAFIKVLDPNAGFALTTFLTADMTNTPVEWSSYALNILIDAGMVGQILQFGFLNVATDFEGSGIYYDNIEFGIVPIPAAVWLLASCLAGLVGFRRKASRLD